MAIERVVRNSSETSSVILWLHQMVERGLAGGPVLVTLRRPYRSLLQNSKLWCLLKDISDQVEWDGNRLSPEDWKDVLTAAYSEQRSVPGINGGIVFLGIRTSKLSKEEFAELIELIYAFGTDQGIAWSEESETFYGHIKHKAEAVRAADQRTANA